MSTSDKATRIGVGESGLDPEIVARLKRSPDGLIAAIAQQHDTGEVLMLVHLLVAQPAGVLGQG